MVEKLTRIMSAACDRTRAGKDHVKVQVADWHALMALADEARATTRAPADPRSALEAETIERCAKVAEERGQAYAAIPAVSLLNAARRGEAETIADLIRNLAPTKEPAS